MESHNAWVLILCLGLVATSVYGQGTSVGFYSTTCPTAEAIIKSTVESHIQSNQRTAPGLLRLSFHDCFIRGCDGSVLINGPGTEKAAPQNSRIIGYDAIDDAKTQLEATCPGVVSCADILQLATRDAVVATGGSRWDVPTGRRDGRVSIQSDTDSLPGPDEAVSDQRSKFQNIGLNTQDLVALVGAHTVGTTSCRLFISRLFNASNQTSTGADPSIDEAFLPTLRGFCPQDGDLNRRVFLDDGSGTTFDTSYFNNLKNGRGILRSDQFLWSDANTQPIVDGFATGSLNFDNEFARSMVKMSNVGVLTGTDGEIRTVCSAIN